MSLNRITKHDTCIPIHLLKNIISSTTVPEETIDEEDTEIYHITLHGIGEIVFKNGNIYEGNVRFGILNSTQNHPSRLTFTDGTVYIGDVKDNQITGKGTYIYSNGSSYTGELVNGLKEGKGKLDDNINEIIYEGEWKNNKKTGFGKLIVKNMTYEGYFINDIKSRKGKLIWNDTMNLYEGEFMNNKIQGNGYFIWNDAYEKFIGQWKENIQNGLGIHIWYDEKYDMKYLRNRYIGEFADGMRSGYGVFFYTNGSKYEGQWRNNKKHGFGVYTFQDGSRFEGFFENDKMIEKEKEDKPNPISKTSMMKVNQQNTQFQTGTIKEKDLKTTETDKQIMKNKKLPPIENENFISERQIKDSESNPFKTMLDITDIVESEPEIEVSLSSIYSLMLRHISDMKLFYKVYTQNFLNETKQVLGNESFVSEIKVKQRQSKFLLLNKEETKERESIYLEKDNETRQLFTISEGLNLNNQIGKAMEMKDFWRFIRDSNILSSEICIADINRIFFNGQRNYMEMFTCPEYLKENQFYDYIYSMIETGKKNFYSKYKQKNKSFQLVTSQYISKGSLIYETKEETFYFDIHSRRNILLTRQFYEGIVRIAYLKYIGEKEVLSIKIKKLLDLIMKSNIKISKFYNKRGNSKENHMLSHIHSQVPENNNVNTVTLTSNLNKQNQILTEGRSLFSIVDVNINTSFFDGVLSQYETRLNSLYKEMYMKYIKSIKGNITKSKIKTNDMTIRYRFIYNLLKSTVEYSFLDKISYVNFINRHHSDKKVYLNEFNLCAFSYYENLLDTELIFIEFVELFLYNIYLLLENNRLNQKDNFQIQFELLFRILNDCVVIKETKSNDEKIYIPLMDVHKKLEIQKKNLRRQKEEERRKENEKIRFGDENKMMRKYELLVFPAFDNEEEEEVDEEENEEEYLDEEENDEFEY